MYPEAQTDPLTPLPTRLSLSYLHGRFLLSYLHPNGRPPLALARQAPQFFPARNGLDDECGGLGASSGRDRCQFQGAGAHGGAIQSVGRGAAPRWAVGSSEALVGRVRAALGGDGDAGRGLASRRDGGRGLSEIEGWGSPPPQESGGETSHPGECQAHTHPMHPNPAGVYSMLDAQNPAGVCCTEARLGGLLSPRRWGNLLGCPSPCRVERAYSQEPGLPETEAGAASRGRQSSS